MIAAPVEYRRASSLEDALDALTEPEARALAGGHSLLPVMKLRLVRPSLLVDIGHLGLRGVETHDGELYLGSLTVWDDLVREPLLRRPALSALNECAEGIGDLQVRNRGTVGGSLAHADPASDMPAVALAFGAELELRSRDGERRVAASEFFLGPFMTALAPGELITSIAIPLPSPGSGSAYVCIEHPASGFALAGAAAVVEARETRIALTGVGAHAFLLPQGEPIGHLGEAEVFGDAFAPAEYRRHLAAVVARRALALAAARAEEDRDWTA